MLNNMDLRTIPIDIIIFSIDFVLAFKCTDLVNIQLNRHLHTFFLNIITTNTKHHFVILVVGLLSFRIEIL